MRTHSICGWLSVVVIVIGAVQGAAAEQTWKSHPPVRPLPIGYQSELVAGAKRFVNPQRGDDAHDGSESKPWKTVTYAVRQLEPGQTLYLRGGIYYERPALTRSGTVEFPITIANYPGELPIIDGGLREFAESPATSWQPLEGGAPDEYVSTKTFPEADLRRVPNQFLPGSWEPMWGIEDERPLALGHFADSLLPLHGYRLATDLRATNEYWLTSKKDKENGIYCGPGLWFNRATNRIHIRLAHHRLEGLGTNAYRGETDPRKVPLIIALGFGDDVLRVTGIKHVKLQGLTLRGATGSPLLHVYGSENIQLDHLTLFGGFPALMVNASQKIRVTHTAMRGLAAPWTSRAHMKYRGTASYQLILQNAQPLNEDIQFSHCEFTDDHDFAFVRWGKQVKFDRCFVDNFNDDGFECGAKLRDHTIFISLNRIGGILSPFTQHEIDKDESPLDHNAKAGVFVFRNVFDLRAGCFRSPPIQADPAGAYLREEGHIAGDHGSPVWPVMHFYHNTLLRETPVFRDNYMFGLAVMGLRRTERDVFNNIFLQMQKVPGVNFVAMKDAEALREGGNILWGAKDGVSLKGDLFAKFRSSPLFKASQQHYPPGWTTNDRIIDPQVMKLDAGTSSVPDLRLKPSSPAKDSGLPIPAEWPDPLRERDSGTPDIGAIPVGEEAWTVGIDGRIPLFGGGPAASR